MIVNSCKPICIIFVFLHGANYQTAVDLTHLSSSRNSVCILSVNISYVMLSLLQSIRFYPVVRNRIRIFAMQDICQREFLSKPLLTNAVHHILIRLLKLTRHPLYHIADKIQVVSRHLFIWEIDVSHNA